jgi:hypothetical protein
MIGVLGGIAYWWSARRRALPALSLTVALELQDG